MVDPYNPHTCEESINFSGVYICKLQTIPCALHTGEVCYKQEADEALKRIRKILAKGDDTK